MITKIVLTGGPCGSKTSALPLITKHFSGKGLNVFTVPEIATMLYMGGVNLKMDPPDYHFTLEHTAFRLQVAMEEAYEKMANVHSGDSLIVYDRGLSDLAAYCDDSMWQSLCHGFNTTPRALRDYRYDAVIHLVTAANGAEAHYTNANNPARNCTLEEARYLDARSRDAWTPCPHRIIVDNSTDFSGKIDRTIKAIEQAIAKKETSLANTTYGISG